MNELAKSLMLPQQYFIAFNVLLIIAIVIILLLKGLALWRSARKGQTAWFWILLFVNTLGILEIIYLLISKEKTEAIDSVEDLGVKKEDKEQEIKKSKKQESKEEKKEDKVEAVKEKEAEKIEEKAIEKEEFLEERDELKKDATMEHTEEGEEVKVEDLSPNEVAEEAKVEEKTE